MPAQKQPSIVDSFADIAASVKKLGTLYVEKGRLIVTERLTILLSSVAFMAVAVAIAFVLLIFISIGVGHLLATSIAPHLAYLIVAGFYLILLVLAILLRKSLFINPIARFMSRLLLEEPEQPKSQKKNKVQAQLELEAMEGGEVL